MSSGTHGPASLLGQVIGGYRLTRVLGKGATGVVFLGERTDEARQMLERTGRAAVLLPDQAAVKVLILPWQLEEAERTEFRRRFKREAQTLESLSHPNILPIILSGEDEATESSYMVLPYLSGGTLHDRLSEQKSPMAFLDIVPILTQLAAAVDEAHRHNVVHRDIKPGNILMDESGKPYLSDFSIARLVTEATTRLTRTGMALGTPIYMAPEALAGQVVDPAADTYSLGMVVYEMVVGLRENLTNPPAPPRALRQDLPAPAEAAILKAIAHDPSDRYPTAEAFAAAFESGINGEWTSDLTRFMPGARKESDVTHAPHRASEAPTESSFPLSPVPQPVNNRRRRGLVATVLVGALTLLLISSCAIATSARTGIFDFIGLSNSSPSVGVAHDSTSTVSPTSHTSHPTATPRSSSGSGKRQPTATSGSSHSGSQSSTPTPTRVPTATTPPTPTFTPRPPTPTPVVKSLQIGWSSAHPTWIWVTLRNFPTGTYTYSCNFSTPPQSNSFTRSETTSPQTWDDGHTCFDTQHGDHVWVIINGVSSNTITVP